MVTMNREDGNNNDIVKRDLTGASTQDLMEVLNMMSVIEKSEDSYVTKWDRLKRLIHIVIDTNDKMMSKEYNDSR